MRKRLLRPRTALGLWLLAGIAGGYVCVFLATVTGVIAKDPTLGAAPYSAAYRATGALEHSAAAGAGGEFGIVVNPGANEVAYLGMRGHVTAPMPADGTVADGVYPLVWVHLSNPILHLKETAWTRTVKDVSGLVGEPGRTYEARSEESLILWDPVIGSQASYRAGIYDGERRVATAVYDMTCGLILDLVTHEGGYANVHLLRTDFPISRNRYVVAAWVALFGIALVALYAVRALRAKPDEREAAADRMGYAVAIAVAIAVDFVWDIWFFYLGPPWMTIAVHAAAIAVWAVYFRWWAAPLLLELAWALAFVVAAEPSLVPNVTHFPALLLTLILMLLVRRTPRAPASAPR